MIAKYNIHIASESKQLLEYDEAWLYHACLFEDGYSDWRMPTTDEYDEFLDKLGNECWEIEDYDQKLGYWDNCKYPSVPVREIHDCET